VHDLKQLWDTSDEGSKFQILNFKMGFKEIIQTLVLIGHAITKAVRHWLLTWEPWVLPPVISC
jgi:hypothetical protein